MTEYKVKFEVFEGPLDLLLYLIKKQEVDIYEVNLTKLATQFLEYLELMRLFDLDVAGEFLVMAATLMYIKSRELLPREQQVTAEGEEDGEDPRWELIRQLVEYKKFKDAAAKLQVLEAVQEQVYPRTPVKPEFEPEPLKAGVSIFDLIGAVNSILKRMEQRDDLREIFEDHYSVSDKLEHIRNTLTIRPRMKFSELFAQTSSRMEIVVTFLAMLELIRLKHLVIQQPEPFAEIEIWRNDATPTDGTAEHGGEVADAGTETPLSDTDGTAAATDAGSVPAAEAAMEAQPISEPVPAEPVTESSADEPPPPSKEEPSANA